MSFNPDDIGLKNGNLFGFPYTEKNADLLIIPVPWDATASYGKGASRGADTILEASTQLDFYHYKVENAWEKKIFMTPISEDWKKINDQLCEKSAKYVHYLEQGGELKDSIEHQSAVNEITVAQNYLKENLKERAKLAFKNGQKVAVLGGEHSCPLGLIEAIAEQHEDFGILQIDAHADLRDAYEDFEQSHASIMFNALKYKSVTKLVQVGIRDISQGEVDLINQDERIETFYDWDLKEEQFGGVTWKDQCDEIISKLPQKVYVSFDIDGLIPSLCPNTGTPVPGGLDFQEAVYLLFAVKESGREIVGFDLCEVAPGENEINAITGARILWNLCLITE